MITGDNSSAHVRHTADSVTVVLEHVTVLQFAKKKKVEILVFLAFGEQLPLLVPNSVICDRVDECITDLFSMEGLTAAANCQQTPAHHHLRNHLSLCSLN